MTKHRTALRAALVSTAALFGACLAPSESLETRSGGPPDDWVQASPVLAQEIQDEVERLPWTHGFERLEQIRWFAAVGEPAYRELLTLAEDPRPDVAAAALASLGATLDRSLVPHVRAVELAGGPGSDLWLERARTLVRLGDWSEIPTLIQGLGDARLYTRSLCLDALKEVTHETQGYDPRADATLRAEAIQRWNLWWAAREQDWILRPGS